MKLISIETQIIKATIDTLLAHGYLLGVNDGEMTTVRRIANHDTLLTAMRTTDEDYLLVFDPRTLAQIGWVRFIYGNDDTEVINDYTTNLEPVMAPIFTMIDKYEKGG